MHKIIKNKVFRWSKRLLIPKMSQQILRKHGALFGGSIFTFTIFVFLYRLDLILPNAPHIQRTEPSEHINITYSELWGKMVISSKRFPASPVLNQFKVAMSEADYNLTLDTLEDFANIMDKNNLTYFQYGGTLIGSVRYHGPIPWDDDIDLLIDNAQKDKVREVLKSMEPDYFLQDSTSNGAWKFFSKHAREPTLNVMPWRWPYLDIWFFEKREQVIHEILSKIDIPTNLIFPLTKRPFGRTYLQAPCSSLEFLESMYNMENCISRDFNHKAELPDRILKYKVPCSYFDQYYPYVQRERHSGYMVEKLVFHNAVVQTLKIPEKCGVRTVVS